MSCIWRPDLNKPEEKTINTCNATIAFMDNTNWIANSKNNLQDILDETKEFYKANDSQINSPNSY